MAVFGEWQNTKAKYQALLRTPTNNRLKLSGKKSINVKASKNDSISTPLPSHVDSPPALADSPSPIPFLCTQDESEVVWNYYSPTSDNASPTHTPTTRKRKKVFYYNDFSPVARIPTKKMIRPATTNTEFLKGLKDELTALNKNLQGILNAKKKQNVNNAELPQDNNNISADLDNSLFESSGENINPCDNSLSSKHLASTPRASNSPMGQEFEDSMNEILIKATQCVEENVVSQRRVCSSMKPRSKDNFNSKLKLESNKITNDSLDNVLGNINDSEIELLASQLLQKNEESAEPNKDTCKVTSSSDRNNRVTRNSSKTNLWSDDADTLLDNIPNISSLANNSVLNESKTKFMRHNSMPESPRQVPLVKKNYNAGKTFVRHISMPVSGAKMVANEEEFSQVLKCTPEDIKRKHQAAKEKLMAKKREPVVMKSQAFYGHNNNCQSTISLTGNNATNGSRCQPLKTVFFNNNQTRSNANRQMCNNNNVDGKKLSLQEQIEKKRQDALMKLQRNRALGVRK